ncbi:MAG: MBL fold metallo-hydrolase [Thermomicrobiales bacterium]|nr:MBL fold metallo-hydrolase [Thermomicrobiales bacterium]
MSLRLTVLGGAAAWPNPGQGCSSYLIESDAAAVLLDCGPNTLSTLREHIDYHSVTAVVLSHWHSDHVLDLIPYRYGLIYGPGSLDAPIPLWVPRDVEQRLHELAAALSDPEDDPTAFWASTFAIREFGDASLIRLGDLTISMHWSQHYVPCYAMRVELESSGHVIAYSADAGAIEPLIEMMRHADLAIIEATLDDHGDTQPSERGHLTPEDAGRLARLAGVKSLFLTHLWSERDPASVITRAQSEYDGPVTVAERGLSIDVN